MNRRKVLMACTHHWTSPMQVGSHHLAREFIKAGYEVAYLSAPITPLHLLRGADRDFIERFKVFNQGGRVDHGGAVWSYLPGALFAPDSRPVLNRKEVYHSWFKTTLPDVIGKVVHAGFGSPDILYIDNLSYWFLVQSVSFGKSVFRIMDNHSGVPGSGFYVPEMVRMLQEKVDLVVHSAAVPHEAEPSRNLKRVYIPNGVDFEHFDSGSREMPVEYRKIPKPIAVYVGAMDARFDFGLLERTARDNPDVSFVLIGPDGPARKRITNTDTVHLLGPIPYESLPAYLYHADVGIIPFNVQEHPQLIHSVHPLKLYQYMACGLAVVSTEWRELRQMNTPAVLCRSPVEFSRAVADLATRPYDKTPYVEFASKHDWSKRLKDILSHLG